MSRFDTTSEELIMPVRTDVPPDIHPDALSNVASVLDVKGSQGAVALALAREALRAGYQSYGLVNDAERAVQPPRKHSGPDALNKPIVTPALLDMTDKSQARVCKQMDDRYRNIVKVRDLLASRVAQSVDSPERRTAEGIAEATEIRRHLRDSFKSADKRTEFLKDRLDRGDVKTLAAVVHAQPYLSGLDDAEHARWHAEAQKKFSADKPQLDAVELVLERIRRASLSVLKRHQSITLRRNEPDVQRAIVRERSLRALGGEQEES